MPDVRRGSARGVVFVTIAALELTACGMSGTDPRAGDNIDVPYERPGRNFPEAAEAEARRERDADYSKPPGKDVAAGYEPAPRTDNALPKPGSNVTPDTEVSYGKASPKAAHAPEAGTGLGGE
ncbi:hypothetical protein [Acetobacter estunensis]|nr:hypothetical protein [Acetobacter estunensis]